jgi:late competence protein required for DNA uptake (superfamily II DNA/RNA helicase)
MFFVYLYSTKTKNEALIEQVNQLPDFAKDEDELVWAITGNAKLELIQELLSNYTNG